MLLIVLGIAFLIVGLLCLYRGASIYEKKEITSSIPSMGERNLDSLPAARVLEYDVRSDKEYIDVLVVKDFNEPISSDNAEWRSIPIKDARRLGLIEEKQDAS